MIRDTPDTPNPSLNKRQRNLQERIMNQYYRMSKEATDAADKEKSDRIMGRTIQGKPVTPVRTRVVRLYCAMDESPLTQVKGLKISDVATTVVKPRYQCPVCFSYYIGWRKDQLKLETDEDVIAIHVVWGD